MLILFFNPNRNKENQIHEGKKKKKRQFPECGRERTACLLAFLREKPVRQTPPVSPLKPVRD